MKLLFVLFLTTVSGLSSVCAGLGDDDDKIEDLYGNLVERHLLDDGTVSVLYHKDKYLYFVIFAERRSILERYSRMDRAELSPKEISRFLKANSGGHTAWRPRDTEKEQTFERSDHKAVATCSKLKGLPSLTVRIIPARPLPKADELER